MLQNTTYRTKKNKKKTQYKKSEAPHGQWLMQFWPKPLTAWLWICSCCSLSDDVRSVLCVCVRALNVNVNIQCQSNEITRNAAENNSRKTI